MKKFAAAAAAVAVVASPLALSTSAHATGSPGCVTKAEFSQVKRGMTVDRVSRIFGTKGTTSYVYVGTYAFSLSKEYRPCQPWTAYSEVDVSFTKNHRGEAWRVDGKSAFWLR